MKQWRIIDERNKFFGTYKYQINPTSFAKNTEHRSLVTYEITSWCTEQWGPLREYSLTEYYSWNFNYKWRSERIGRARVQVYIKNDDDFMMFMLRWA